MSVYLCAHSWAGSFRQHILKSSELVGFAGLCLWCWGCDHLKVDLSTLDSIRSLVSLHSKKTLDTNGLRSTGLLGCTVSSWHNLCSHLVMTCPSIQQGYGLPALATNRAVLCFTEGGSQLQRQRLVDESFSAIAIMIHSDEKLTGRALLPCWENVVQLCWGLGLRDIHKWPSREKEWDDVTLCQDNHWNEIRSHNNSLVLCLEPEVVRTEACAVVFLRKDLRTATHIIMSPPKPWRHTREAEYFHLMQKWPTLGSDHLFKMTMSQFTI